MRGEARGLIVKMKRDEARESKEGGRPPVRRVVEPKLLLVYCLFFPLTAPEVMAFPSTCPETLKAAAISLTEWYMATIERKKEDSNEKKVQLTVERSPLLLFDFERSLFLRVSRYLEVGR